MTFITSSLKICPKTGKRSFTACVQIPLGSSPTWAPQPSQARAASSTGGTSGSRTSRLSSYHKLFAQALRRSSNSHGLQVFPPPQFGPMFRKCCERLDQSNRVSGYTLPMPSPLPHLSVRAPGIHVAVSFAQCLAAHTAAWLQTATNSRSPDRNPNSRDAAANACAMRMSLHPTTQAQSTAIRRVPRVVGCYKLDNGLVV